MSDYAVYGSNNVTLVFSGVMFVMFFVSILLAVISLVATQQEKKHDEIQNINVVNNIQYYLEEYLRNSDDEIFHKIIERIQKNKPVIYTHLISNNKLSRFKTTKIELKEPIKYSIKAGMSSFLSLNGGIFIGITFIL